MGVISPIGNNLDDFWKALCNGESGVDSLKAFDTSGFSCKISGEIKNFDPSKFFDKKHIRRMGLFAQYALASAIMAVDHSGLNLDSIDHDRAGVVVGSGIGGLKIIESEHRKYLEKGPSKISPFLIPMLIVNIVSGEISIKFGFKGPNTCPVTACATGTHSIGDAFKIIQRGDADIIIAGGTEAAITPLGFGGFCSARALSTKRNSEPAKASRPFDGDRDGFVMAEGAGIVVLENLEHAKKRKAKIYAEVAGYAMTGDAYHITAPAPGGIGSAKCLTNAVKDAGLKMEDIDYINAHGTSTYFNDKNETAAIKTAFGDHAKKLAISSIKSMTGHMLGAAGAAEFIATVKMLEHGIITPTINYENPDPECDLDYVPNKARKQNIKTAISNSLGFGGHNAAIVLKRY
jgi:3-oxoacyl-[acyl-carrier-protein] synthase II